MQNFFRKLLIGNKQDKSIPQSTKYADRRKQNLQAIWNSEHHEDFGLERVIRLFLASIQFIFPVSHIKHLAEKSGSYYKDLAVELCIIIKILFPLFILIFRLEENKILHWILIWVVSETILYIPAMIFASDTHNKPKSYRRSMLLLFLNYFEVILAFAVLYSAGDHFNHPFTHWFDGIYFSMGMATALGPGDFIPVTTQAKFLVVIQQVLFLLFVVISLNFFTSNIEKKGYFRD